MLPQTRQAVAQLQQAGLTRKQFRIRTPFNYKVQGYTDTFIVLRCPYQQVEPLLSKLAAFFKVIVTCLDGMPCHISIEVAATPGLYKYENGCEEQVTEIVCCGSFRQLSLWNDEN